MFQNVLMMTIVLWGVWWRSQEKENLKHFSSSCLSFSEGMHSEIVIKYPDIVCPKKWLNEFKVQS